MPDRDWISAPLGAEAFERLATELSGSELQSVLLEVTRRRARARKPHQVVAQYRRDGFCKPAAVDQRTSVELDGHLLAAAQAFEAIELSPVAPLATCSSVAPTDQNRVLGALRALEVVSDPTNVLALECALRMRAQPTKSFHLTTSQRVLRAQPVPDVPGYAPHFRIFVLASGGREAVGHAFTMDTIALHVRTILGALDRLERHGYAFGARRVDLRATPKAAAIADRVAERLGGAVRREPLEHPYYSGGLRFVVWVTAPDGTSVPLADGGAFDWLTKLAANRRAVYIASGLGAQLISLRFRVESSALGSP